jgi:hypothetical protein
LRPKRGSDAALKEGSEVMTQPELRSLDNPYVPPAQDEGGESRDALLIASAYGYQDQTLIVRIVTGFIAAHALASAYNAIACAALVFANLSWSAEELVVSSTAVCFQVNRIIYFIGIIPFATFLVRANQNARLFAQAAQDHSRDMLRRHPLDSFSPASMVYWFFVPFANLVKPYQAVHTVWTSSAPQSPEARSASQYHVLSMWWVLWLVVMFWAYVKAFMVVPRVEVQTHNVVIIINGFLVGALCFFALRMVQLLDERQRKRAAELWK